MNNLTFRWLLLMALLWPLILDAQILTSPGLPTFPAIGAGVHSWGDYDNDGDADLFLSGLDSTRSLRSWIFNNSGGTFSVDPAQQVTAVAYGSAAWSDYDNDGDPDLAVTGMTGPQQGFSCLYENQGGVLQPSSQLLPTLLNGNLEWADLDADGDPDLIMSGLSPSEGNTGYLMINQGNGVFQVQLRPDLSFLEAGDLATGDLNGDGLPDLVFSGGNSQGEAAIRLMRNLGNYQFSNFNHVIGGARHSKLSLADIDADGQDEIVLQGIIGQPQTSVYELSASGQIVPVPNSFTGLYRGDLEWFDFDNDGDMDLVSVGRSNGPVSPLVYRQDNGVFTQLGISPASVGLETATISVANIDSDPELEILVSGQDAQHNSLTYVLKYNPTTQRFEP